jgi:hypothetical protein
MTTSVWFQSFTLVVMAFVLAPASLAQSANFEKNNAWLEKQFNAALTADDKETVRFNLRGCEAQMEIRVNEKDSNFGFSMGTSLASIQSVAYKKQEGGYRLELLTDKSETNNNSFNFSFGTNDEQLMQEIKQRLEANIAECKKMKQP